MLVPCINKSTKDGLSYVKCKSVKSGSINDIQTHTWYGIKVNNHDVVRKKKQDTMRKPLYKNSFLDSKRQGEQERKKLGFVR